MKIVGQLSDKGKPVVGQMSDRVKGTENTKKAIRHRSERELTEKSKRKKKKCREI